MIDLTPTSPGLRIHNGLLRQDVPTLGFGFRCDTEAFDRDVSRTCLESDTAYGFVRGGAVRVWDARRSYQLWPNTWFSIPGMCRMELAPGARGFVGVLRSVSADFAMGIPSTVFRQGLLLETKEAELYLAGSESIEPADDALVAMVISHAVVCGGVRFEEGAVFSPQGAAIVPEPGAYLACWSA